MLVRSAQGIVIASVKHSLAGNATPEWAHVSGWAQLSAEPRTVSCVLLCVDSAPLLPVLLAGMSDALTEAGFPWEITCIDSASSDATAQILSSWSELPGFRWIRLAKNYGDAVATRTGLAHARGDAVILVKVSTRIAVDAVPGMVERWNEGHEIVLVRPDSDSDTGSKLVSWDLSRPEATSHDALDENKLTSDFILMDRQVVDLLLK